MSLIFIFLDGVGLGDDDGNNPFSMHQYPSFTAMTGGQPFNRRAEKVSNGTHLFSSIDACLGIEYLPQSGTGQVTLFSGINAARKLGRHFGPYPHSAIRELLEEESLFQKMAKINGRCHFINAFPDRFISYVNKTNRWTSTTYMTMKAGLPVNSLEGILDEKAITADLTQAAWKNRLGLNVPVITEAEAAERVIQSSKRYDLVLVEYYLTDKAGHSCDPALAHAILTRLDRFLDYIISRQPVNDYTILLTSDHGNLENLAVKSHTRNEVPLFVMGKGAGSFYSAGSIQDITPLFLSWYESALWQGQ